MMKASFDIITIFPEIFKSYLGESILKRAIQKGLLDVKIHNLRDFSQDKHKTVDDYPYGGGPGMVMKIEPIYNAIQFIKSDGIGRFNVLLSPQGRIYNQRVAESFLSKNLRILLICGRYEGIDERVVEHLTDDEISVGDYILTGGELAALVIIDSITRLIPGVLGDDESVKEDSFTCGIFDYPHYTRPPKFKGIKVPDILLSGNHQEIKKWRKKEALKKTFIKRPDLINKEDLSLEDRKLLEEIILDIQR